MKNLVRKNIVEVKNKKDRLLIEENLVKSRLLMIFENEENIKNFHSLPQKKKEKIAWKLVDEINYLSEQKFLNEQFGDFLSKIFGNSLGGILETLVEPLLNSILSGLGMEGYFKNFLISFLTTNPMELARALKDCRTLTTLIANALSEALFMNIQEQKGLTGGFMTFLRNTIGGAVKDTAFINKIEDFIGDIVCSGYKKLTGNAQGVFDKLKGSGLTTAGA